MNATLTEERLNAERNAEQGTLAVFKGRNLIRFIIAAWPKIAQQLVGLAVFNTYATYFCKLDSIARSASWDMFNAYHSPVRREQGPIPRHRDIVLRSVAVNDSDYDFD